MHGDARPARNGERRDIIYGLAPGAAAAFRADRRWVGHGRRGGETPAALPIGRRLVLEHGHSRRDVTTSSWGTRHLPPSAVPTGSARTDTPGLDGQPANTQRARQTSQRGGPACQASAAGQ